MPERDACVAPKKWFICLEDGTKVDVMPLLIQLAKDFTDAK